MFYFTDNEGFLKKSTLRHRNKLYFKIPLIHTLKASSTHLAGSPQPMLHRYVNTFHNRAYEAFAEMIGWEVGSQRVGNPCVGEQDNQTLISKSL
jgi:hypothetical protein